ncbi:hypothetical protein D3C72_1241550 [compost metagenome]
MLISMSSGYVFLTDCSDFSEAQVVRSYLLSLGFSPKVRDEQMRSVAPHLNHLLGKLIIDIPEDEFFDASQALEKMERPNLSAVNDSTATNSADEKAEKALTQSQAMAKKALANSILGCIFLPVICNLYSIYLGLKVLKTEKPLSSKSRARIMWSMAFNTIAFYFWLTFGPTFFLRNF